MFAEATTVVTMGPIALGLLGLLTSTAALIIPKWLEGRAKRQDWKRQDEVARRVEETAKQTAAAAVLLVASNERVASNAAVMNVKLDDIHTWTNAKMTESMQSELESKEVSLALLLEMVDFKKGVGQTPSSETLGRIKSMSARIDELKLRIAERLKQQAIIDAKPRTAPGS